MATKVVVNAEALFKELSGMESKAQSAIDGLLAEKSAARVNFEQKMTSLDEQIKRLDEVYKAACGRYYLGTGHKTKEKSPRVRRTKEEKALEAQGIVELVKSKGKDGASGGDIRAKFPMVGASIMKFIAENGGGKVTTTGEKSATRYYAQ